MVLHNLDDEQDKLFALQGGIYFLLLYTETITIVKGKVSHNLYAIYPYAISFAVSNQARKCLLCIISI